MKSEAWVHNWLQKSEHFLCKEEISELTSDEIKEAVKNNRPIDVPFILSVLYTGRNKALRKVLELDNKVKVKQKSKGKGKIKARSRTKAKGKEQKTKEDSQFDK